MFSCLGYIACYEFIPPLGTYFKCGCDCCKVKPYLDVADWLATALAVLTPVVFADIFNWLVFVSNGFLAAIEIGYPCPALMIFEEEIVVVAS